MLIRGTLGDDTIEGTDDADRILGLAGGDTITGADGADVLIGGPGEDTLLGGAGNDDLRGGGAGDNLAGGSGDDTLRGGAGADILGGSEVAQPAAPGNLAFNDPGNDTIFGGPGNDRIGGGTGVDILDGGTGDDLIFDDDARGTFHGGTGDDEIVLSSRDTIPLPNATAFGDDGDDSLTARLLFGRITLDGGAGNDTITGSAAQVTIRGRGGDDRLQVGPAVVESASPRGGDPPIDRSQSVRIAGGGGDDSIQGGGGSNDLLGGAGDDVIQAFGVSDRLTGGPGIDTFVTPFLDGMEPQRTVILDFVRGEDQLFIPGRLTFADFDTNDDGVLTILDTNVSIATVEIGGVALDSTILTEPVTVVRAGVASTVATITLFGVTGLQATDFLVTPTTTP